MKIFKLIISNLTVIILLYLGFAFVTYNLNPKLWSEDTRFFFTYISYLLLIIVTTLNFLKKD